MLKILAFFILALVLLLLLNILFSLLRALFLNEAVWVPSNQGIVKMLFDKGFIKSGDCILEIGSGDGRISLEFARLACQRRMRLKVVGIEKQAWLFWFSNLRLLFSGKCVRKHVEFKLNDAFRVKLDGYTLIYLFMPPTFLRGWLQKKLREISKGTIIVSAWFEVKGFESLKLLKIFTLRTKKFFIYQKI